MPDNRVVIIHVEFGSVQGVEHPADVDVHIIDLDTDGVDQEELCNCEMGSVVNQAHLHAEYPGEAGGEATNVHEELLAALQVLVLTPHILNHLEANDPMALEQARAAIAKARGPHAS